MSTWRDQPSETQAIVSRSDSMYAGRDNPLTVGRIINFCLIGLYTAAIVFHVVSLAVIAAKHNELVDKYPQIPNIKDSCILFANYDNNQWKWVNNKCDVVIFGSGVLAGCALLMIIFLAVRTVLFKTANFLGILDGVQVAVTGVFAAIIAIIITLGKNETCKSVEEATRHFITCQDFYLRYEGKSAQIYQAMRTAQVTSWIAVGVLGVIAVITAIRVLLWLTSRRNRGSVELHPPLVENDQLSNAYRTGHDDDDVKPLPL